MAIYNISKIQLPNGDICNLKDNEAERSFVKTIENENIIHIEDAAAMPLKELKINIEPVQTGSGDPSPENVRPITGWSGVKLARTGASMLDGVTIESGYYDASGVKTASDTMLRTADMIPAVPGRKYMIRIVRTSFNTTTKLRVHEFDASGNWLRQIYESSGLTTRTHTFWLTVSSDAAYIAFSYPNRNDEVRAEWDATTYDLSFGSAGTVYGGTLDVISGELVVDRAMVDLGALAWADGVYSNFVCNSINSTIKHVSPSTLPRMLCSALKTIKFDDRSSVTGARLSVSDVGRLDARGTSYLSAAEFKTAMSGVQLVYELAEPQTYHLTPLQVQMLFGENNIWSDTGTSSCTYYVNSNLTTEFTEYKKLQTQILDPVAENTATAFISSITQNVNGVITALKANLPTASTSSAGIVQLNTATNSTSTTQAATPSAVKSAYDLALAASNSLVVESRIGELSATKITSGTLSSERLPTSGVTAGSYGPAVDLTLLHGDSFNVPLVSIDDRGRVTSAATKAITLPSYAAATSSTNGLMSSTDKSKLDNLTTIQLSNGINVTEDTDGVIFTYVN